MKICVLTFNHWTDLGLDISERGEGRWGLNLANLLGKAGHEVCLLVDEIRSTLVAPYNIRVCTHSTIKEFGSFDIYLDPAWEFHKQALVPCRYHFANFWAPASWTKEVPKSVIKLYPYTWHSDWYKAANKDISELHCLPAPFGEKFIEPEENDRDRVVFCAKNLLDNVNDTEGDYVRNRTLAKRMLLHLQNNYSDLKIDITYSDSRLFPDIVGTYKNTQISSNIGYDKIKKLFAHGKLNMTIFGPSCSLDSFFQGCPSTTWHEQWYFEIAKRHNLLVDSSNAEHVLDVLLCDKERTNAYVRDFQNVLSEHLEENVIKYFDNICKKIGLV
jgi:hypothetical protein